MKSIAETKKALNFIRELLDKDVMGTDIDSVSGKLISLTQIMGLSAESIASARKILHQKEIVVMQLINTDLPASMQSKKLSAECFEEIALVTYADRLNAAITHNCESLRTVISLYKQELQSSLIHAKQN